MGRLSHGSVILLKQEDGEPIGLETFHDALPGNPNLVPCPEPTSFGYLFPDLQDDGSNRLPSEPDMAARLIALGNSMSDPHPVDPTFNSTIPSAYTYLGQFITHDLTLEAVTKKTPISPYSVPLTPEAIKNTLGNKRTAKLDLDSVYGPIIDKTGCFAVPQKGEELEIARAYPDAVDGDIPRNADASFSPRIGDPRNDESLILSQLHLAFLRAHNAIVRRGNNFADAQRLLKYHYQWLVTHDFLDKIADPAIVADIRNGTIDIYPHNAGVFMPFEFSAAAFRFGHSMIRSSYNYNANFKVTQLEELFMPGALGDYFHILKDWIIDWERFVRGPNYARLIDTRLVDPLAKLLDEDGKGLPGLAALDLVRGYVLRLPTGQAVAHQLLLPPEQIMTDADFAAVAGDQIFVTGLSRHTPLWFYILAEAARFQGGQRLGPVGSTLVAGVLIGLVRESNDSYMHVPNFVPTLGQNGRFDLAHLFQLAGVLT